MAIREDLVASAVTFLQDPSVAASPIESRTAFLQSKNLTHEEVEAALARASGETSYTPYAPQQQQIARQPQNGYGGYPEYGWQYPPPPAPPRRDWRDWFIMATVMGGVGYGVYAVAKRYLMPLIAPPTEPQLEQDKRAIDESFEKAFALLEQLGKDTETLKSSEQARTERLDTALIEVETVISDLKSSSRRREDDSRRITDEVRALKDLIPKAMESQKEATDARLQELNAELKSLKKLMGQRMNPSQSSAPSPNQFSRTLSTSGTPVNGASSTDSGIAKPAPMSNGHNAETSLPGRTASPLGVSSPAGRSAIPAWQMAAANKATSAGDSVSGSQEASEAT